MPAAALGRVRRTSPNLPRPDLHRLDLDRLEGRTLLAGEVDRSYLLDAYQPPSDANLDITGVQAVYAMDDGRTLVYASTDANGTNGAALIRLDKKGRPDASFDDDGFLPISFTAAREYRPLAIRVAGTRITVVTPQVAFRLDDDGSRDKKFGHRGAITLERHVANATLERAGAPLFAAVTNDGGFIVAESDPSGTRDATIKFSRFRADGTLSDDFGTDGRTSIVNRAGQTDLILSSLTIDHEGRAVVAGTVNVTDADSDAHAFFLRLTESGLLDGSFGDEGIAYHRVIDDAQVIGASQALAQLEDGRYLTIASRFVDEQTPPQQLLIAVDEDGDVARLGGRGDSRTTQSAPLDAARQIYGLADGSVLIADETGRVAHLTDELELDSDFSSDGDGVAGVWLGPFSGLIAAAGVSDRGNIVIAGVGDFGTGPFLSATRITPVGSKTQLTAKVDEDGILQIRGTGADNVMTGRQTSASSLTDGPGSGGGDPVGQVKFELLLDQGVGLQSLDAVRYEIADDEDAPFDRIRIEGRGGDDLFDLKGVTQPVTLVGGSGDDTFFGGTGDDSILAGEGDDAIGGEGGDDTLVGGGGKDTITGSGGDDRIEGESGSDVLRGVSGNDTLYGARGNDRLDGGSGNDYLDAGADQDTLLGGAGKDRLYAGVDDDSLNGGDSADTLDGGTGDDRAIEDLADVLVLAIEDLI